MPLESAKKPGAKSSRGAINQNPSTLISRRAEALITSSSRGRKRRTRPVIKSGGRAGPPGRARKVFIKLHVSGAICRRVQRPLIAPSVPLDTKRRGRQGRRRSRAAAIAQENPKLGPGGDHLQIGKKRVADRTRAAAALGGSDRKSRSPRRVADASSSRRTGLGAGAASREARGVRPIVGPCTGRMRGCLGKLKAEACTS